MIRRLFTAASVLSLILFLATFALVSWSDFQLIRVEWGDGGAGRGGFLQLRDGRVSFYSVRTVESPVLSVGPARRSRWDLLVFVLQNSDYNPTPSSRQQSTLCWFELTVLTLAAMPLSVWLVIRILISRFKRQHRMRTGRCVACGYDLRASKDRCPECGKLMPAEATA